MITAKDCLTKYGPPEKERNMVLWHVPDKLRLGAIPKRVYCNRDLVAPLDKALNNVIDRGLIAEIKSWDGCFNIRKTRGGASSSLHSWGVAIDICAAGNGLGKTPTMSKALVNCFKDAGFNWGGDWRRPDGMHFELASCL